MGIANPVTRETHGSGTHYHLQLAKQLGDMLQAPLEVGLSFCVPVSHSKYITLHFQFHKKSHTQWGPNTSVDSVNPAAVLGARWYDGAN